jgi:hypothetical protein
MNNNYPEFGIPFFQNELPEDFRSGDAVRSFFVLLLFFCSGMRKIIQGIFWTCREVHITGKYTHQNKIDR